MRIKVRKGPAKTKPKAEKPKVKSKPATGKPGAGKAGAVLPRKHSKNFKKVLAYLDKIEENEKSIASLKEAMSDVLTALKADSGMTSFKFGDHYYSIRTRSGRAYVVKSDVPFGSWRKKGGK